MSNTEPKMPKVKIANTLLYGIFVSQKSYLIGLRNLVKREHADMLASNIIGDILPQELIDMVADFLYEMEQETVQAHWNPDRSLTGQNVSKFEQGVYDCPAYRKASARISALNIATTPIQSTRPITGRGTRLSDPPYTTYIHLSCSTRPSIALSLPPTLNRPDPISPAIFYNAGNALLRVRVYGNDAARGVMHEEEATYMPCRESKESREKPLRVARLLQGEGVEDAIRGWDAERVRKFVELLGLVVVPFEGATTEPMKPGLHIWQRIGEV